jgi:tripartite-type tricarboxylate transporter receptor subunit TctC
VSNIARAQTYPWRPVRIIVGFTAGSATDITARLFAQKLNDAWNVPVTVENIPGVGGSVGAERVAKSAPDGSTFYWGANGAMRRHGGNRRTAEQRDEFPPPHSITSSASENRLSEILTRLVRRSVLDRRFPLGHDHTSFCG